jgi:hypothetical protein
MRDSHEAHCTLAFRGASSGRSAQHCITDYATIVDYPVSTGGEFRILRTGSRDWTCLPGPPPGSEHDDPGCFDSVFLKWVKDGIAGWPQHIDTLGVAYMYMGQWVPGAGFIRGGWNGT